MNQHVMKIGGRDYKAEVKELSSEHAIVFVDGQEYRVELNHLGQKRVTGDMVRAALPPMGQIPVPHTAPSHAPVSHAPTSHAPMAAGPSIPAVKKPSAAMAGQGAITAPMPGSIFQMKVKEGDQVNPGQVLLVMEAMKMENPISASYAGAVTKVYVREGDNVGEGDMLVEVSRPELTTL